MKNTKRLVLLAMLTAVAMILSYVESLLPSVGIPGVKMGLANIAVIFALFRFGWKEAAAPAANTSLSPAAKRLQ